MAITLARKPGEIVALISLIPPVREKWVRKTATVLKQTVKSTPQVRVPHTDPQVLGKFFLDNVIEIVPEFAQIAREITELTRKSSAIAL